MNNPFHIITPSIRFNNLPKLRDSIINNKGLELFDLKWWLYYDTPQKLFNDNWIIELNKNINSLNYSRRSGSKNMILDLIISQSNESKRSSWLYVLDDDNIIHPNFFNSMRENIDKYPNARGFIFSQMYGDWIHRIRLAKKEYVKVGSIDQAQYVLNTDIIGDTRFQEKYGEDGIFINEIYNKNKDKFIFIDKVLAYYNRLNWKTPDNTLPKDIRDLKYLDIDDIKDISMEEKIEIYMLGWRLSEFDYYVDKIAKKELTLDTFLELINHL